MVLRRAVIVGLLAWILPPSAQAVVWNMATPYGADSFHTLNVQRFADDVETATGGALEIRVHSGGSLVAHTEIKNAVADGRIPLGEFLLAGLAAENAVFAVDSVPFLADNYPRAEKLWRASRPHIEELLGNQGLVVLFAVPWPPQGIYTRRPIARLADLKGVRLRSYDVTTKRIAELAGAESTHVDFAHLHQALASGRIEAMITSPAIGVRAEVWNYLTHYYHVQGWLPKNVVVINARRYESLPASSRQALLGMAERAEQRGWQVSQRETDEKLAELRAKGVVVRRPPTELRMDLMEIGRQMTFEWTDRTGVSGIRIIESYYALE